MLKERLFLPPGSKSVISFWAKAAKFISRPKSGVTIVVDAGTWVMYVALVSSQPSVTS